MHVVLGSRMRLSQKGLIAQFLHHVYLSYIITIITYIILYLLYYIMLYYIILN